MTTLDAESRNLLSRIPFHDFEVVWAGSLPDHDGFCFGSDDGRIAITDKTGVTLQGGGRVSEEAINGVAVIRPCMAISTRSEVGILTLARSSEEQSLVKFPMGAHGVIAGHSGYFFAPLGIHGLMSCKPSDEKEQAFIVSTPMAGALYFYQLTSYINEAGVEVLACAIRSGGVAAMEFRHGDEKYGSYAREFNNLDVIDICMLSGSAAAALDKNRMLILYKDVLRDPSPTTLLFPEVRGRAYRVLSSRGHLYLLTSTAFYAFPDFARDFCAGNVRSREGSILELEMAAIDANIAGENTVLIVTTTGVLKLDVEALEHQARQHARGQAAPSIVNVESHEREVGLVSAEA